MKLDMKNCTVCPRKCGIDRSAGTGACGCTDKMHISKVMLHRWEEPSISGSDPERGSGAVFFSGCPLHCVFCQNKAISKGECGKEYSSSELAETMLELRSSGAYNINFVSPTQYTPLICEAVSLCKDKLTIPTVWNTGGYETPETVAALSGYVDVFLTDFKYASSEKAKEYAAAADYPEFALASLREMVKLTGKPRFDENGMLLSGVIVRHLVLPGERLESEKVISVLRENFAPDELLLSLMRQYTPDFYSGEKKNLKRRVTSFEYSYVLRAAEEAGFSGYTQSSESSVSDYTPDFI